MDKSVEAFRTIGEMAKELNVKTHILRYWEEQFPMLQPLKRAGGRRHYRPSDVALLKQINQLLGEEGYTIKGARKFLASGGNKTAAAPQPAPTANPSVEKPLFDFGELKNARDRLAAALESA